MALITFSPLFIRGTRKFIETAVGPMSNPNGVPITFKDGVVLYPDHMVNVAIPRIFYALSMTAPKLVGEMIVITELWREGSGYHPKCRAVDVRTGVYSRNLTGAIVGSSQDQRKQFGIDWAKRLRLRLGYEFDVIFGTDNAHIDHMHIEHDEKKQLITWTQS